MATRLSVLGIALAMLLSVGCASTNPTERDAGWVAPAVATVPVESERPADGVRTAPESMQEAYEALLAQEPVNIGKHKANLFVGGTTDRGGGGFTLGFQYEYEMQEQFGIGALVDVVFANKTSTVLGAAFYYHPAERWSLLAAPGVEFIGSSSRVIARVGGAYEFPVKGFVIAPAVYVDLNARDGTPIIAGAYISRKF